MPPPLSGRIGKVIKSRLESAVYRCKSISWETLSMYLEQDENWVWDRDLILEWRQDISALFLTCCKDMEVDGQTIQKYASALDDGLPDINGGEAANEAGNTTEGSEDDRTTVRPYESIAPTRHPQHNNQPSTIKFLPCANKKKSDGLSVRYTEAALSRISSDVIQDRWEMGDEIYQMDIYDPDKMTKKEIEVIDLTWELEQGPAKKTYSTTFEVVPEDDIKWDAEFGQNRFEPISKKLKKAHSITKSLSAIPESQRSRHPTKPRSHTGPASVMSPSREEFVLEKLTEGLAIYGNREYEKKYGSQASLSSSPEYDDGSSGQSRRHSGGTSNTSNSKNSNRKAQSTRDRHR